MTPILVAWDATARLASVAVLLQTVEYIGIAPWLRAERVWDWRVVRDDFQFLAPPFRGMLDRLLSYNAFTGILVMQGTCAVLLAIQPQYALWSGVLLATLFLTVLRWRGSFNGGSDSMTLVVLLALFLGSISDSVTSEGTGKRAALAYIAIQSVLSYFLAGTAKLKQREWRNGNALREFLRSPVYDPPALFQKLLSTRPRLQLASAVLIAVECSAPAALVDPIFARVFLICGACFHAANIALLGLNRFFWIWIATYPAIWFWSQRIGR